MNRRIVFVFACFGILLSSCKKPQTSNQELLSIVTKLQTDNDFYYLKTLEPNKEDIKKIVRDSFFIELLNDYSKKIWQNVDLFSKKLMMLENKSDKVAIVASNKMQLVDWRHMTGVPIKYNVLSEFIYDDITVYGLQFIDSEGNLIKERDAFFKVDDKWIFIPEAYKAFIE
ncbi:hypothetical protein FUA26_00965 [Seonamhaeicola algicola]|uniref:Lipoprotein n=1 Tax=Seonamhaeicola algicola TaxID=1719036 RepID=A0A5C7B2I6_9FLAO|nr:hypothetical protein [Seonamhaeicola algicola]TXE15108.1 hypothetical protein FUA26_00965 [Seonamhaeicola algicola]